MQSSLQNVTGFSLMRLYYSYRLKNAFFNAVTINN